MDTDSKYDEILNACDEDLKYTEQDDKMLTASPDEMREQILSMFDGNNNIVVDDLNDADITRMIQTQKEYEKYGQFKCGHKIFVWISNAKMLIFNVLFLFFGLMIAETVIKQRDDELYDRAWFYTFYFSFLILCVSIARLLLYCIMKLLQRLIKNSWKVFYIKDIRNRLYLAVLCILWFLTLTVFGDVVHYDYNENIYKLVQCTLISSGVFLVSYIFIRYIALTSYFDIFHQRARTLKAYTTFIEIMLDLKPDMDLFDMPLMNFLIDFPTQERTMKAKKENRKDVSFKFCAVNINMTHKEKKEIAKMVKMSSDFSKSKETDNNDGDNADIIYEDEDEDEDDDDMEELDETQPNESKPKEMKLNPMESDDVIEALLANDNIDKFKIMADLLGSELYTVNLNNNIAMNTKVIPRPRLKRLSMLISYLIIVRLNKVKTQKIFTMDKYRDVTARATNNKIIRQDLFDQEVQKTLKGQKNSKLVKKWHGITNSIKFSARKLELAKVKGNKDINEHCLIEAFKSYHMANKDLLIKFGILAWKKFRDRDKEILSPEVLNINIIQIIDDLLKLKQSIDSYIVIIRNLQRMIDVITPILLLFVYLYIFNLDFQQTLTLYVSSVGIIGFFGSSYFGSVFASISFIIALNPFLVGDKIWLNNDFYKVREISLISCIFENLRTGWSHTFQNKSLGKMSHPIINLSRSGVMTYRFILYFKSIIDNKILYQFANECSKEIEKIREKELKLLQTNKNNNKSKRCSYCSFSELKNIDFQSVIFKSVTLDDYGRKQVWIEMKYEIYSWNVRTLCFNSITNVANRQQFKPYLCDSLPLKMDDDYYVNTAESTRQP